MSSLNKFDTAGRDATVRDSVQDARNLSNGSNELRDPTPGAPVTDARLRAEGVTVEFGVTRALDDVSFSVKPGEIVGVLGHNGAGKSTLFNAISGALRASTGTISVDGRPLAENPTPEAAAEAGITVIHQEPALAPNLSVIDNLFLRQRGRYSHRQKRAKAREVLDEVGAVGLDLDVLIGGVGLGTRQQVDLARGMLRGEVKVLMLDEPTAALGRTETEYLHALIRELASRGVAVLYVSHRLPDILDVCTRIMVLRAGELVIDEAAEKFDGPTLNQALAPGVEFRDFAVGTESKNEVEFEFAGQSIRCRGGQVTGFFGMAAGEQFELFEELFGLRQTKTVHLNGQSFHIGSPSAAMHRGIHLVPADRERDGLVAGLSAKDTVYLPWYRKENNRGHWLSPRTGNRKYERARSELNILGPPSDAPIDQFSGGNRQKHLIARWAMIEDAKVLLLAQPTQGVDVGARIDIVRTIREVANLGIPVLVASAEADEIELLCDKSFVVYEGMLAEVERHQDFSNQLTASLLMLAERADLEIAEL